MTESNESNTTDAAARKPEDSKLDRIVWISTLR